MAPERRGLAKVAAVFLKLGTIGFGGPAAHIALTREEVVRRRRWLTEQEFLDVLGANRSRMRGGLAAIAAPLVLVAALGGGARDAVDPGLARLFLEFLKFGAVVFGSGYVLLAFLEGDLVEVAHEVQMVPEEEPVPAGALGLDRQVDEPAGVTDVRRPDRVAHDGLRARTVRRR